VVRATSWLTAPKTSVCRYQKLAPETTRALTEIMPAYGTVQNPLDVTGTAINNPSMFTGAITAMSADPSIGVVAVVNSLPWESDGRPYATQAFVDAIGDGVATAVGPVVHVNQVQQPITKYTRQVMDAGRVPYVLPGLRQAVTALSNVAWWSGLPRDRPPDAVGPVVTVAAKRRRGAWTEIEARALLAEAGIPLVPGHLATSEDDAAKLAAEFGGPVALKIVSKNILHKSDIGGVRLGVVGEQAARRAYADVARSALQVPGPLSMESW